MDVFVSDGTLTLEVALSEAELADPLGANVDDSDVALDNDALADAPFSEDALSSVEDTSCGRSNRVNDDEVGGTATA